MDKDEIIDSLSYKLRKANERIVILESENRILRNKLDNAEYKIKKELEPRIQRERKLRKSIGRRIGGGI